MISVIFNAKQSYAFISILLFHSVGNKDIIAHNLTTRKFRISLTLKGKKSDKKFKVIGMSLFRQRRINFCGCSNKILMPVDISSKRLLSKR